MNNLKKLGLSGLSIAAVAAGVAATGGTSAFYYDAETFTNSIEACGFDLSYETVVAEGKTNDPNNTDAVVVNNSGNISITGVHPGDYYEVAVKVQNLGDCGGELWLQVDDISNLENGFTDEESQAGDTGPAGELGEYVQIGIPGVGGTSIKNVGWFSAPQNVSGVLGDLSPTDVWQGTIYVDVPLGNRSDGNQIMTDSFSFALDLALVQDGQNPGAQLD
ncbi:SipW-dependent-type signal peptide-containing protein [Nocardioides pakistanensis]